ncbi:MAG: serine/threonine-protein kinase [Pseudomonadota bacterium]
MSLSKPTPFGEYILIEKIAAGGMAEIFRAEIRGLGGFRREVAIKRILPQFSEDESFVSMLLDEARIAARLVHPNIVQVLNCGEVEGSYFIAMEFVDGQTLSRLMSRLLKLQRRLSTPHALFIAVQLLRALGHAHRAVDDRGRPMGLVHRDVSPQNLLISYGGEVKLTDFGVVHATDKLHRTETGVVKGKLAYMAPEQLDAGAIDNRVDQYAAAIVTFEMLCGSRAFRGTSDIDVIRSVINTDVGDIAERLAKAGVHQAVAAVVRRCLERDPDKRFSSCDAAADALQALLSGRDLSEYAASVGHLLRLLFRPVEPVQEGQQTRTLVSPATRREELERSINEFTEIADADTLLTPPSSPRLAAGSLTRPDPATLPARTPVNAPTSRSILLIAGLSLLLTLGVGSVVYLAWQQARSSRRQELATAEIGEVVRPMPDAAVEDRPVATAAESMPRVGTLVVTDATPGVAVRVDGILRGTVADDGTLSLQLPADSPVRLSVERPDATPFDEAIALQQGQELRLAVPPARSTPVTPGRPPRKHSGKPGAGRHATGFLDVACLPWCEISIDGKKTGKTSPLRHHPLPPGQHQIDAVNPPTGARQRQSAVIRADSTTQLNFRLR